MREESAGISQQAQVLETLATASGRNGVDPLAARLLELRDWLGDDLVALEGTIQDFDRIGPEDPTEPGYGIVARRAARHLLEQTGKRIRPLCVMIAARAGGVGLTPEVRDLAVVSELVHAATLLHDDVIDEGTERRKAPAARILYGNSASVLGGDHLLVEAMRMVEATQQPGLLVKLMDTISAMVFAEAIQLERRGRFMPDREVYLRIIEGKTAALFRWAFEAGATVAGLSKEQAESLGRAGIALGKAFQLVDDVLDLDGDPAVTGKNAFADLREGKLTWPFILGAERDEKLAATLKEVVCTEGEGFDPAQGAEFVERLRAAGCIEDTRAFAVQCSDEAREALQCLPPGKARQALEMVVEAVILRSH